MLNATGVIVHTNLGRAPLAGAGARASREIARGYSNLEYDLDGGRPWLAAGPRRRLLRRLTGAEAALVVNNNAAAVMLALAALAEGREVLVSRGELIEIGDGFRIPDVLERSGARARRGRHDEPHAGRRLRAGDRAGDGPALARSPVQLPRGRLHGATSLRSSRHRASSRAAAGRRPRLRCAHGHRRRAHGSASLAAGADLVSLRDKLLGGPQAGIVVGRADLVERLRRHPLQRALRADKLTLAALEGTLTLALDAPDEIPVLRMLREPVETVRARAERLAARLGGEVEETVARAGGGALPLTELPSYACAVEEALGGKLRDGHPPVIAVVRDGRTLLDCRTLTDTEADEAAACVESARR